jgi:hypothetical protein
MIVTKTPAKTSENLLFGALLMLASLACNEVQKTDAPAVTPAPARQQELKVSRPPFAQYLEAREPARMTRKPPPPVTADAARRLAEFERQLALAEPSWAKLSSDERTRKRAELKYRTLIDSPSPTGPSGGR